MDPLIIHHVIRHRLSRIETNNFQDKSGCSINGFRSFLFEEGIVRNLDGIDILIHDYYMIQDYRVYLLHLDIYGFDNFPLSDEILRMKYVRFILSKPIHKLVSPEPHFVEEDRNLIENHFYYLGKYYENDDIEEWKCFQMDNEGHLVSIKSRLQLSNGSIEHLSNLPHLRNLFITPSISGQESVTNFSLLSNLRHLTINFVQEIQDPELFKDLGLFSNLLFLFLCSNNGF